MIVRPVLEAEFQESVIQLAELCGWMVYHVSNVRGKLRSKTGKGFPDLVMAKPGKLIFAELKSEAGKLTVSQKVWIGVLSTIPVVSVRVWRPADWSEIEKVLTAG